MYQRGLNIREFLLIPHRYSVLLKRKFEDTCTKGVSSENLVNITDIKKQESLKIHVPKG